MMRKIKIAAVGLLFTMLAHGQVQQAITQLQFAGNANVPGAIGLGTGMVGSATPIYTDASGTGGALGAFNAFVFPAPTLAATVASTYSTASTLRIPAPVAGTNATITTAYSLNTNGAIKTQAGMFASGVEPDNGSSSVIVIGGTASPTTASTGVPLLIVPQVTCSTCSDLMSINAVPIWDCRVGCASNIHINNISSYHKIASTWADGQIQLITDFNPGGLSPTGSNPSNIAYVNYQSYASTNWACAGGTTISSTCGVLNAINFTGIPGVNGTLMNYGIEVGTLGNGGNGVNATGSTLNLYNMYMYGVCPTAVLGTQSCYNIYSTTSAPSSFNGPIYEGQANPTISGCGTAGSLTFTGNAGTFTVGTGAATCTFTITVAGGAANHGWIANVDDVTAKIHCTNTGSDTTTTAQVICNSTVSTSDKITVSMAPY